MLSSLRKDLIYAVRMALKTPVVTAIAVVSLALGVAANTTIFAIVNQWLLRPFPYHESENLVMLWEDDLNSPDDQDAVSVANYLDWRDLATSFTTMVASEFGVANLTGLDRPERVNTTTVTANIFGELSAEPMLGRTFFPDEGGIEDEPVVVLGEMLWRTRFGANPEVVGQTVTINGRSHTVVGVMPETFDWLFGNVGFWIADDFESRRGDRANRTVLVTARLQPGATPISAQAEMSAIAKRLEDLHPETNANFGVNVETLREIFPGPTDKGLVQLLMGVVFLVLIVACVNIASLLMAKTDARQKEIAVRVALGAGRGRLLRQLLTESVVLAAVAGTLGLVLSIWGVAWLGSALPDEVPHSLTPQLHGTVIGFSIVASLLAGLTFGITPAMQAVRGGLRSPLIEGSRGGTATVRRRKIRSLFVITEFALALTILVGAAMLTDLFHQRLAIDPGYEGENLLTMELTLPEHKYEDNEALILFVDEFERELDGISGSSGYALMNVRPRARGIPFSEFTVDGVAVEAGEEPSTSWLSVSPDYFDTMGIAVLSGRTLSTTDRAGAPPVVMVNERLVERFFDGEEPVGKRLTIQGESREIVGVARNVAQERLAGLTATSPSVYFPIAQRPIRTMNVAVRTTGDPHQQTGPVQEALWRVDSDLPVTLIRTMDEVVEYELAGPNMMTQVMFAVGFLALALAAIGIYGVMAFSVSQQTNEIGIRIALGASANNVLTRVARQGATLTGIGLLLGVPSSVFVIWFINVIGERAGTEGLVGTSNFGLTPIIAVVCVLATVGLVGCYLPARRAAKVDPMVALQQE
jgi:putative ABC transport system permease protein